jgi:hypothetical protein
LERALAAMLEEMTSGTRPRPNSGAARNDKAERAESGSAEREHVPENEHECPESENEQQESVHGRSAPDDQDDDTGCI